MSFRAKFWTVVIGMIVIVGGLLIDMRLGGHVAHYLEERVDPAGYSGRGHTRGQHVGSFVGDVAGEPKFHSPQTSSEWDQFHQIKILDSATVIGTWQIEATDRRLIVRLDKTFEQGVVFSKAAAVTPDGIKFSYRTSCIAEGSWYFDGVYLRPRILKMRDLKHEEIKVFPPAPGAPPLPDSKELALKLPAAANEDIKLTYKETKLGGTVKIIDKTRITMDPGTGPVSYTKLDG